MFDILKKHLKIKAILAIASNGAIGISNKLPWDIPEDLKYFKEKTTTKTVVMGRKTWESIPERFRPLPNRENIVITTNKDYEAPGATVVSNIEDAIIAASTNEVWIIGGASIYKQILENSLVDEIHLTIVPKAVDGDSFFYIDDILNRYNKDSVIDLVNHPEYGTVSVHVFKLKT